MPEIRSPIPKISPQTKLAMVRAMILSSEAVPQDSERCCRASHEDERRHDRAPSDAGKAADTVAGGPAIAHPAAEADQKTRNRKQDQVGGSEARRRGRPEQRRNDG